VLKREVAWQKLSGDVFRKPEWPIFFSSLVGAGAQLLIMFMSCFFYTIWSLYSPLSTTYTFYTLAIAFVCLAVVNGYISARLYKFFNGTNWIMLAVFSSSGVSGFYAGSFCLIYLTEAWETGRIVFSEILVSILIWLFLTVPCGLIGTYLGFREPKFEVVNKPTRLARKSPKESNLLLNPVLCLSFTGFLPFMVIGGQFYFIF
jgi:transmembrane 9 superfamily member 2/4